MRIACGPGKRHHVAVVGILLTVATLVVGVVACDGADTYELTISSTAGGSVTTPGEGTFTYDAGTVVRLVATPDDGYQFHLWTGDIQLVAGPNLPSTTIVMNGDYAVTASFEIQGQTEPGMP